MTSTVTYKIPPTGQRINIGRYALHTYQRGDGTPTVVFENGLGGVALQWRYIQEQIAQITHTLSYDRAGQGWSDPSPLPRTPQQLSDDLHQLLGALQIAPPYVLVAHSFGGLISRYYAHRYSNAVKGLVLVDTSHEMQLEKLKGYAKAHKISLRMLKVLSAFVHVPFVGQLLARQAGKPFRADMPEDLWQQFVYLSSLPKYYDTTRAEMERFDDYFGQTHIIPTHLGDLPLIVVTAAESILHGPAQGGVSAADLNEAHQHHQAALARMSSRGQHVVVPGATHLSILSNPTHAQYVIEAIRQLVHQS